METLQVSIIQEKLAWEEPEKNRKVFTEKIKSIQEKTDLIILPEMFTTGFSMHPKDLAEAPESRTLEWMRNLAEEKNTALCGSWIVKEEDRFYNRLYVVFPDGSYQTYDKRHLFSYSGENEHYSAGKEKLVIEYKGWKICPLICYDLRFPVWSRNTEPYDFLFYIANWPASRISHWDSLLKARSIENLCYTAGINRIGTDPNNNEYNGHSSLYDPTGQLISTQDWESAFVNTFLLDKNHLKKIREKFRFLDDRDAFELTDDLG